MISDRCKRGKQMLIIALMSISFIEQSEFSELSNTDKLSFSTSYIQLISVLAPNLKNLWDFKLNRCQQITL